MTREVTREEAIKWQEVFKRTYGNFPPEAAEACDMAIEALQEPEIVHCKDCKHWYKEIMYCTYTGIQIEPNGYCVYGDVEK